MEYLLFPFVKKCSATRLPPTVVVQFSPLACGRTTLSCQFPSRKNSLSRENSARLPAAYLYASPLFVLLNFGCQGGRLAGPFCAVASCDSCVASLYFMALKKGCRVAFLVLGNLRLCNIAMHGPCLFFSSQSFPACVYKKRLRARSSVIIIAPLLSFLLLHVRRRWCLIFRVSSSASRFLTVLLLCSWPCVRFVRPPMALNFYSNQLILLFFSLPFFLPTFGLSPSSYSLVLSILKSLLVSSLLRLNLMFVNGREIRPLQFYGSK